MRTVNIYVWLFQKAGSLLRWMTEHTRDQDVVLDDAANGELPYQGSNAGQRSFR